MILNVIGVEIGVGATTADKGLLLFDKIILLAQLGAGVFSLLN